MVSPERRHALSGATEGVMMDPTGIYIILGTVVLAAGALAVWDWLAERDRLRRRDRGQSA